MSTLSVTPINMKWDSMYDGVAKIQGYLAVHDQDMTFSNLCNARITMCLLPQQEMLIAEYMQVIAPISFCLAS